MKVRCLRRRTTLALYKIVVELRTPPVNWTCVSVFEKHYQELWYENGRHCTPSQRQAAVRRTELPKGMDHHMNGERRGYLGEIVIMVTIRGEKKKRRVADFVG